MTAPALGFLGVGWIGRHRMDAVLAARAGRCVAVADPDRAAAAAAVEEHGGELCSPEELLARTDLDGVLIATPSALHATQSIAALDAGTAVFCQKPLARTAPECEAVVAAARRADRLLGVDLSYRHLAAVDAIRPSIEDGRLGPIYAAELVFHNAYGPDKPWFLDPKYSGGGCVIDLGIHLVDLVLDLLDRPKVEAVTSRLYAQGRPLPPAAEVVEDYATARLDLATGATVDLTCSWFLHAGQDAVIGVTLHGPHGSVAVSNVGGSFYDFTAECRAGTSRTVLTEPPDPWGGRAALAWARRLAVDPTFDPAISDVVDVATVLDRIYGR